MGTLRKADTRRNVPRKHGTIPILTEYIYTYTVNGKEDYKDFVPETLAEQFTVSEFAKAAGISPAVAQKGLNVLRQVEAVEVCGRSGEGKRKANEIGVASLRMGNVVGVHEVHICTPTQSLTLRHDAITRGMLADGAVDAARFVNGKPIGLYTMEELLEEA